jgi:5-methylcytosine-specific restriction enzyme subunit McrC
MSSRKDSRKIFSAVEQVSVDIGVSELLLDGKLHIYPEITGKNYFRIFLRKDQLVFQAGGYIGLIPINDRVAIDVRPRVPVANLERVLRVAEHVPVVLSRVSRAYDSSPETFPSLIDIVAQALLGYLDQIFVNGKYREYQRREEETAFPRGRVLFAATLRRHSARGDSHHLTATWHDATFDNGANRCLKYAVWYLAQRYQAMTTTSENQVNMVRALNVAFNSLGGIHLDLGRQFLKDNMVINSARMPVLRNYYVPAINLAKLVIRDEGVKFDGHREALVMSSLLINLEQAFEIYLRRILFENLKGRMPKHEVLDGNRGGQQGGKKRLFDQVMPPGTGAMIEATPDIVIRRNGTIPDTPGVIEIKYKASEGLPDRDDINQAISYGISYRASFVILVLPRTKNLVGGLTSLGSVGSVKVFQYRFDLANVRLQEEEQVFVSAIESLLLAAA